MSKVAQLGDIITFRVAFGDVKRLKRKVKGFDYLGRATVTLWGLSGYAVDPSEIIKVEVAL
jgi:hypothetical protein